MAETNPYESPASGGVERPRLSIAETRTVKSTQFAFLGLQFTVLGAMILLPSLAIVFRSWWGLLGLAARTAFLVSGQGMLRYKPWGWHCAVVLVVPLLGLALLLTLAFGMIWGWFFLVLGLLLVPLYCFYTLHALFSRAGRQRYADAAQAKNQLRQKSRQPRPSEPLDLG
jgi:fatty acid desaturase